MLKLAAELGVPVQIHTRAGVWTDLSDRLFGGQPGAPGPCCAARGRIPDLKILLCHAGFPPWWQAADAVADLPNCVLDVSNWNEHFDEHHGELVARLATWRSLVGTERILFASDQASGMRFTGERSTLAQMGDFFRDLPANAARWGYRFSAEEAEQYSAATH